LQPSPFPEGRNEMQRITIRIAVALLLLVAGGSTVLANGPGMPPTCPPGEVCK